VFNHIKQNTHTEVFRGVQSGAGINGGVGQMDVLKWLWCNLALVWVELAATILFFYEAPFRFLKIHTKGIAPITLSNTTQSTLITEKIGVLFGSVEELLPSINPLKKLFKKRSKQKQL
jgi:hypothetical protein